MPKTNKKTVKRTIKPGKDIVTSTVHDFKKKLQKLVEQGIKEITIDFNGVDQVDSMGIGLLIATHNSLDKIGGILFLKNIPESVYLLFKVMRLDQQFKML